MKTVLRQIIIRIIIACSDSACCRIQGILSCLLVNLSLQALICNLTNLFRRHSRVLGLNLVSDMTDCRYEPT